MVKIIRYKSMPFRGIFDTVLYNHNHTDQTESAAFAMCIAYGNATGVPQ